MKNAHDSKRVWSSSTLPVPLVTIRSRLVLLMVSVLLPAMAGIAWLIASNFDAESEANERTLRETTRALSMVVDSELTQRATVAVVLSQSTRLDDAPTLTRENLLRFELLARRALQGLGGWVQLRTRDRVLLDTRLEPGEVPTTTEPVADDAWAERPLVRPLQVSKGSDMAHVAIVEPVQRDGRTVLNLVLALPPAELQRILNQQRLPANWVSASIDSHGVIVARYPGGAAYVGRQATPDLRAELARSSEDFFEATSLDGIRMAGYHHTSARGWSFLVSMPRDQFAGPLRLALAQVTVGALMLLALAIAGALWVSRRIVLPVDALKSAAAQMQAGQRVEYSAIGIVEYDEVANAMSQAADTLEHRQRDLERQVADAVQRTKQAEQHLSKTQRIEALGRLTGGLAHDFNNLLGVISNCAHLIQRHALTPELQAPVATTLRAVQAGSRLTEHLLRFAGRRALLPEAVSLSRFLPELLDLIRSVLGRHIEISVQVAADTELVSVDLSELELALVNLALNARDAMPNGGSVQLRAHNADAEDSLGLPPARYVMISLSDDGQGMDPELASSAFDPFFTTKATGKGTGLGLSQVHGFCVQAGGVARLASTPGVGSTVSMLLPAGAKRAGAAAPDFAASAAPRIDGARVLLVEDNLELGDVTAALLAEHGARVMRAANAVEALRLLAGETVLDIVLSDVVMPGDLDGLALARRLREERPSLPVVLITGYSQHGVSSDEFAVLRKPTSPMDLLRALQRALLSARAA